MFKEQAKKILSKKTYDLMSRTYRSLFAGDDRDNPMIYPHKVEMIGGKLVCPALIPNGATIISGGVGSDLGFELEMIKRKNAKIIGIDPTTTAEKFIDEEREKNPVLRTNYTYLKKALSHSTDDLKLYYGDNDFMSSVSSKHRDAKSDNFFICQATTIDELQKSYFPIAYLKIDIEGAEYPILEQTSQLSVPQISIEFHHHCSDEYPLAESIRLIQKIAGMGYDVIDYGAWHGRERRLPQYAAKWSDLNCELLFIKR